MLTFTTTPCDVRAAHLRAAATFIRRGWTTGTEARTITGGVRGAADPGAARWCSLGGFEAARLRQFPMHGATYLGSATLLAAYLSTPGFDPPYCYVPECVVAWWNDHEATSGHQVARAMERLADLVERVQEQGARVAGPAATLEEALPERPQIEEPLTVPVEWTEAVPA